MTDQVGRCDRCGDVLFADWSHKCPRPPAAMPNVSADTREADAVRCERLISGDIQRHVVMFSGGLGSWAAARRVAAKHGTENLTLLFADTLVEDADLYRFLGEAAANIGGKLVRIAEGRTIWEVFRDEKFLGNSRVDPCSRILKRQVADRWLSENCEVATTTIYVGIDWSEEHRFTRLATRHFPWRYEAPLCEAPFLTREQVRQDLVREGIRLPRLYDLGFSHNNCGGGCVKAGIGHFTHLLRALPDVYNEWECNEAELRRQLGDVAILRDRSGGRTRPLPLSVLRGRIATGEQFDAFDVGGCGCFTDVEPIVNDHQVDAMVHQHKPKLTPEGPSDA